MPDFMSREVVCNEFSRQRPGRGEALTENRRPGDTDVGRQTGQKKQAGRRGLNTFVLGF